MAYYDALIAKWPTLTSTTTDAKLAEINALTAAGPNVDVPTQSVVGTLMLSGAYLRLSAFAQTGFNGVQGHDTALSAAMLLMALVTSPNAPPFNMADSTRFTLISVMLSALLAQETASAGSTGVTQAVYDALLALSATTIPWWQSAAYPRAFDLGDITTAGLS